MSDETFTLEGGCTCRTIRYRMHGKPLFVHCCHCRWCQRETGSAFVLNAMIEAERVAQALLLRRGHARILDHGARSSRQRLEQHEGRREHEPWQSPWGDRYSARARAGRFLPVSAA